MEKHYTFLELWNASFMFEKKYTQCIKENKDKYNDTNIPCDKYKKEYEMSRDKYTECLISTYKYINNINIHQCDVLKNDFEKSKLACFNVFRDNSQFSRYETVEE